MAKLKVFKKLKDTSDKLVAMDLTEDDSSTPSGSSLPAQLLNVPNITLTPDALGIGWTWANFFTSNGKTVYDFMPLIDFSSIPLIDRVVEFGNLRLVSVWATVNPDFSVTYELSISEQVFVFWSLTPPLPLWDTNTAGAVRVYNIWFVNPWVSDRTIGVDTADVWSLLVFPNMWFASGMTSSPIIYWNASNNEFRNRQTFAGINVGNSAENVVSIDFFDGVTIPHDTGLGLYATMADGDFYFVPEHVQSDKLLALVYIFNDTGSTITIDANDLSNLNDPLVNIQIFNYIVDWYIGTWTTAELNPSGLLLFDGYMAYLDGNDKIYRWWIWYLLGWWSSNWNTFSATSGYDFSAYTSAIIPVRYDSSTNEVLPASAIVPVPVAINPIPLNNVVQTQQAQIDATKMVNVAISSIPDVYACVVEYDPDKWTYANALGSSAQVPTTNLDSSKKVTLAKVDYNIFAMGYHTTWGGARISLIKFNGEFLEMLRNQEVAASDISDFKVFTGNRIGTRNPYKQILFAGWDTNAVQFFTGSINVTNNWDFVWVNPFQYYASLNAPATWTDFSIDGNQFGDNTTSALLMFKNGDLHCLDIGTWTILDSNTFLIGSTDCFKVKAIDAPFTSFQRWIVAAVWATQDWQWSIAYFDGTNLNVWVPTTFAASNTDRQNKPYAIDVYANNAIWRVYLHTILDDTTVVQVEQYVAEFSGTSPWMVVASGTINTPIGIGWPYEINTTKLRIQPQEEDEVVLGLSYVNSSDNFETKLLAYTPNSILQNIKTLPQRDEIIGVINTNAWLGDTVTVYKNGAEFASIGAQGTPYYVSYNGEWVANYRVSPLRAGIIDAAGNFQVDIRPPTVIADDELDIKYAIDTINPYTSLTLDNQYSWYEPINIVNTTIQSLSIVNANDTGYSALSNPNVWIRNQYIPRVKWDVMLVQQSKDYASASWNILQNTSDWDWVNPDVTDSNVFDNNALQIPIQLKTAKKFSIAPMANSTLEYIYGLDIGTEFLLRTTGADVTIVLSLWGSWDAKIVSNSWRPSVVLSSGTNTYVRMKVLPTYEIQFIEYVSAGEIINLDEAAITTISISNSEILNGNSAPKLILPAPWVNKIYDMRVLVARIVGVSNPYATSTTWYISYAGQAIANAIAIDTVLLPSVSNAMVVPSGNSIVPIANTDIEWKVDIINPTAWDGELQITIQYKIIDL